MFHMYSAYNTRWRSLILTFFTYMVSPSISPRLYITVCYAYDTTHHWRPIHTIVLCTRRILYLMKLGQKVFDLTFTSWPIVINIRLLAFWRHGKTSCASLATAHIHWLYAYLCVGQTHPVWLRSRFNEHCFVSYYYIMFSSI